jgi:serine/threonine-protein kinase
MIGTQLGPWKIDQEIGRGGMGSVYRAHRQPAPDGQAPERVAVKILAPELAQDPGFVQRFQREINILRQLSHPNIVRFFEAGEQDGRFWFAMEYVEGHSYEALLHEHGRLGWQEALEVALQVTPALKHAHDRGIIHRDLKPANLLRAPGQGNSDGSFQIKLTDFGIASLFASPHLTVTGGVVGTAEYLSPEQAMGKAATRRSDLYSLGVSLYTLITGRTPFVGEMVDLLHKHRFGQFDQPIRLVPELPHELNDVICQLLEKDPDRRPADAAVLHRQLDSFRRRYQYRQAHADLPTTLQPLPGQLNSREGPATLMSRLMRHELEKSQRGGPIQQFFNRPLVLWTLFLLTVGILVWTFWPLSSETKYQRGMAQMSSDDPAVWTAAWEKYLQPLYDREPENPHREELQRLHQRYEQYQADQRAAHEAEQAARHAALTSEAHWFYLEGLRRRQAKDEEGARKVWQALIDAFAEVPGEGPWVRLAQQELQRDPDQPNPANSRKLESVRQAVAQADHLQEEGKHGEAEAIRSALRRLYQGDAATQAIIDKRQ